MDLAANGMSTILCKSSALEDTFFFDSSMEQPSKKTTAATDTIEKILRKLMSILNSISYRRLSFGLRWRFVGAPIGDDAAHVPSFHAI